MRELRISMVLCISALLTAAPLSAKTLIFCSEGSP
jgi:hypothetical protein